MSTQTGAAGGGSVTLADAESYSTVDVWYKTEPYQQLVQAVHAKDAVRQNQIIERSVAATSGAEKAFWLTVRCGVRAGLATHATPMLELAWADLEEAFRTAPEDHRIREIVLFSSLGLCLLTEKLDRMVPMLRTLRHDFSRLKDGTFVRFNLGTLHLKRGRWKAAYRSFCRAEAGMKKLSPEGQVAFRGRLGLLYTRRAVAAVACGLPDAAAVDVAAAAAILDSMPNTKFSYLLLAVARAELALCEGRFQEGRAALQLGLVRNGTTEYAKAGPGLLAEADLMAARIARAEGNQRGFEHFCQRALTAAQQKDLPMTLARIRAVMAGAAR